MPNLRRNNIILYGRINARFKDLYEVQRLRYDDVITQLAFEFCKAEATINNILRIKLPTELPPLIPNQLEIF